MRCVVSADHVGLLNRRRPGADAWCMTPTPGWYQDPAAAPGQLRWWSDRGWTEATRAAQVPQPWQVPSSAAPTTTAQVAPAANAVARTPHPDQPAAADVWLPPQMVEYGHLPPVCVRHGRPAARMQPTKVFSRMPLWVVVIAIFQPAYRSRRRPGDARLGAGQLAGVC